MKPGTKRLTIVAALAACLTSCADTTDQLIAAATPPKFAAEQYEPLPKNYKAIASAAVKAELLDPYSAHVEFQPGGPIRSGFKNDSGQWEPAWQVSMWVNAKNRFGAYTGSHSAFVLLEGGRVVQVLDTQALSAGL